MADTCVWEYDDYHDCFDTGCGNSLCLIDGGPEENGYLYCPCCGKTIEAVINDT